MTQPPIDKFLDELEAMDVPPADDAARAQAIAQANQIFDQGLSNSTRPKTNESQSRFRRFIMSVFDKRLLGRPIVGSAFAAIALVGVAVPVLMSYQSQPEIDSSTSEITVIGNDQALVKNRAIEDKPSVSPQPVAPEQANREQSQKIDLEVKIKEIDLDAQVGRSEKSANDEAAVSRSSITLAEERQTQLNDVAVPKRKAEQEATLAVSQGEVQNQILYKKRGLDSLHQAPAKPSANNSSVRVKSQRSLPGILPSPIDSESSSATQRPDANEEYPEYDKNQIVQVSDEPISTFSADVDTASYALVRNQLTQGFLPAQQMVRAEEFINYFDYDYPLARSKRQPFEPSVSVMDSPWNQGRKLVHIGIKGYDIEATQRPDSNLVFLIDVSGSMSAPNKLPLAKQSIGFLLDQLKPSDKISIAVYAGAAGMVLEPTEAKDKSTIMAALNRLNAGGSTAGGAGIELAYQLAEQNFDDQAVNRIVLLTDGDFNVGQTSNQALLELVERKRESGVLLSVLGFGRNNYQDDMMQTLAQNGNGVAAYIDTLLEAKKVLVDEASAALFPIAKDVKFQVEFNPSTVSDYRLIGYETRALATQDFNNDKVDAGDIGAGHTVTAIYEIAPAGSENQSVDTPRYEANQKRVATSGSASEYGFLKMRYKLPKESRSKLIETPISIDAETLSEDAQFSVAVAAFAQLLSGSKQVGDLNYDDVIKMAKRNKGKDDAGYRQEFIQLVEMARLIK